MGTLFSKNLLMAVVVLIYFTLISSCGPKEIDKIGDTQYCLNTSPAADAENCLDKIEGIETVSAFKLRCAAKFIKEGFSEPATYVEALKQVGDNKNQGGVTAFMSLVTFTSNGEINKDTESAATTFGYCEKSGAKGSVLISAFGYLTLGLYKYFSDAASNASINACGPTPTSSGIYDLTTCLNQLITDPIKAAPILIAIASPSSASAAKDLKNSFGAIIISTYKIACTTSSTNPTLCDSLKSAVTSGNNDPEKVGEQFFNQIIKASCASCPTS